MSHHSEIPTAVAEFERLLRQVKERGEAAHGQQKRALEWLAEAMEQSQDWPISGLLIFFSSVFTRLKESGSTCKAAAVMFEIASSDVEKVRTNLFERHEHDALPGTGQLGVLEELKLTLENSAHAFALRDGNDTALVERVLKAIRPAYVALYAEGDVEHFSNDLDTASKAVLKFYHYIVQTPLQQTEEQNFSIGHRAAQRYDLHRNKFIKSANNSAY